MSPHRRAARLALAESERWPLGDMLQRLLDRFQPIPDESRGAADDWKSTIEARLHGLEQQVKMLSPESKPIASRRVRRSDSPVPEPEAASFKEAVIQCYQSGITGFQEIADQLSARGYRNSSGNPYHRKQVARIIAGMK